MSQFTINGITFEDDKDSLQHGLGVGGGRGRPKGSRNGYINPNAAYMKNYQVVGEVADYSDPLNTGKRPANPPRERTWAPSPQSPGPTRRLTTKEAQKRLIDSFRKQGEYKAAQRPAASVQSGKTLMENILKEQTLPEQTIQEQYLTETKPIEVNPVETKPIEIKTIENKSEQSEPQAEENSNPLEDAWNGLLDWGKNAWNDLSTAATGAIDTGKGWAKDGLDWVNKNILDPAGDWGSRAISDVGNWIGDRGRELDRWWNGYGNAPAQQDRRLGAANDQYVEPQHVSGFRENAGNWLNQAGRDVGQWVSDRGQDLDRWWNGYENTPVTSDTRVQGDLKGNAQQRSRHVNGFRENAGNWINNAIDDAGNWINNAVDDTGRWINDRGQDLNRFWNGYESAPVVSSDTRVQGDLKGNAQHRSRHVNGFAENATELGNTFVRQVVDAAGNVRDAVVNGYGEVIGFLERAPERLSEAATSAGQAIQNIPTQVGNRVQDIRVNMSSAANAARDAGLDQGIINTLLDATQNGTGQLSEEGITNLLNEYAAGFTSEAEIRRIADEVRNGK